MSASKIAAIVSGSSVGLLALIGGGYFVKKYCEGGVCYARRRLDGKVAIVTGSNTGIGIETVAELARRGCTVVMACRSAEKMADAKKNILERYANEDGLKLNVSNKDVGEDLTIVRAEQIVPMVLDLASVKSITKFVKEFTSAYQQLDLLICNAGVMMTPYSRTEDGFEMQIGTNHMGHFLLTELVIPMVKSSNGRIIMVSSLAHYRGHLNMDHLFASESEYNSRQVYSNSKLANVMYAKNLANRFGDNGPLVMSLHPGVIRTELGRHINPVLLNLFYGLGYIFMKNPWQGAQTTLHCALAKDEDLKQGGYYSDCRLMKPLDVVEDAKVVETLAMRSYNIISSTQAGENIFKRKE